jgi:hypothetical protein
MKQILLCSLAASAALVIAMSSADAATRRHHAKGYHSGYYSGAASKRHYVRMAADGVRIDRDGWRHWMSWDNSCFRNLDYLHSQTACGGGLGGY